MTVFVHDMYLYPIGQFGRMKMSHLVADTHDELLTIVCAIGVNPRWIQHAGTPAEHFDIAIGKRTAAIKAGAIAISYRQCAAMRRRRQVTGSLGSPDDAITWLEAYHANRKKEATHEYA